MSDPQPKAPTEFQDLHRIAFEKGGFVTDGAISCEAFEQQCNATVQFVRERLAQLESLTSIPPTRENFLMPLDDLVRHIANKRGLCWTFDSLHPDSGMRELVTEAQQRLDKLSIEIDQSPRLAYIMESVDIEPLDALDRRFVAHWKRDFRRAGCILAPDQREQVKQLSEREAELGRKFDRNIVDGHKSMFVRPEQLKGMSDEFMRNHPVREDGKIELKTNYADRLPVLEFCEDDGVRKDMWFLANNVAVPENAPVFKEIVAIRSRLATLLGYVSYAAYSLEPEMIGSPENAYKLIQELHDGTVEKTRQERMDLQSALRTTEPVHQWQVFYAKTLLGKKRLEGFSPEDAREYFRVATVVPGLLKHAEQFYSVKFIARSDVKTWHETVLVFDVQDQDESKGLLGRIYLDHILRDGKQDHPCMMNIAPGVKDKQLPEAILIVGLGSEEDATMSYWDATACWHELGHVMHQILGGHEQRYQRFSGIEVEADFVEAPSQLAEEWLRLPEVLKSFARNKKGETIPDDMIDKLLQSNTYTKCIVLSGSHLVTARLALMYHELTPDALDVDLNRIWRGAQETFAGFPLIPADSEYHPELSFGHFYSYGPRYISYDNSLAIAKEMLQVWKDSPLGLQDLEVSRKYRKSILEKGSTIDATEMVKDFLGRAHTTQGYLTYLNE